MSSVANDIYIVWKEGIPLGGIKYLKLRKYDAAPLVPQNLSVSNNNGTAVLTWNANLEPDVRDGGGYKIKRARTSGSEPTSFDSVGWTSQTTWTDPDMTVGSGNHKVFWVICATDKKSNESALTNYVWLYYDTKMQKIGIVKPEYKLFDCYPNPFNPATKIQYSVPSTSRIVVKLFDILGNEVALLKDEIKETGIYELTFNSNELASGVYIYQMTAYSGNEIKFTDSKRMILAK